MTKGDGHLTPVILAGGSGNRLWPLSHGNKPKQFHSITGQLSLFQETLARINDDALFAAPIIVANIDNREVVIEQLNEMGISPLAVIFEPVIRNTAPAIVLAAMLTQACGFSDRLLIMPCDHYLADNEAFITAVGRANEAVTSGKFAAFGIIPDRPETGYGYIRTTPVNGCHDQWEMAGFVEKPSRADSKKMLREGNWLWNSGIYLFPAEKLLDEMHRLNPGIMEACRCALLGAVISGVEVRPSRSALARAQNISIDHALMERIDAATIIALKSSWVDVGSWASLWQVSEHDPHGNVAIGDVLLEDVEGAYVRSQGPITAVIGLTDVIVVNSGNGVIVAAKSHLHKIRHIAETIQARAITGAVSASSNSDAAASRQQVAPAGRDWASLQQVAGF